MCVMQDKIHLQLSQASEKEEAASGDEEHPEKSPENTERADKAPRRSLSRGVCVCTNVAVGGFIIQ